MITKETFIMLKSLHQHGVYLKDIAAELGVHPKTISRALKRDGAPSRTRASRESKLEPYKPKIDQRLSEGVWNAMVLLKEIQAEGYIGGATLLRKYIAPKRVLQPSRKTVRFETQPGEQLQTDWGEVTVTVAGQAAK